MEGRSLESALAEYGKILEVPVGHSMKPMLCDRRDTMVISAPKGEPGRGDVILFKNSSGEYVLHRVIKNTPDGFVTRGDNCTRNDAAVPREAVFGVLEGFYKG